MDQEEGPLTEDLRLPAAEHLTHPGVVVTDPGIAAWITVANVTYVYAMYAWTVRELQDGLMLRVFMLTGCDPSVAPVRIKVIAWHMPEVFMHYSAHTKTYEPSFDQASNRLGEDNTEENPDED